MGCDIHLAVEVRKGGKWERRLPPTEARDPWLVKSASENPGDRWREARAERTWYDHRNYDCFAILANVRNGFGVAGIATGGGFTPISAPRGLPPDMSPEVARLDYSHPEHDEDSDDVSLGEHSRSWLTLAELLACDWTRVTTKRGYISLAQFAERVANGVTKPPVEYAGDIYGARIKTLSRA